MTDPTLARLRKDRDEATAALEAAHKAVLDRVLELADQEGANVTKLALEAGIARATVYNELARRQEHRDTLEERPPVPPAPADVDVELSPNMRAALEAIAAGRSPYEAHRGKYPVPPANATGTLRALRRRGLLSETSNDLTPLGELVAEALEDIGAGANR